MPRPPMLPNIDWKAVFDSGQDYAAWLSSAESPDKAHQMVDNLQALGLDPQIRGFLGALPRKVRVLANAEDWCGDVVRHVPVLRRMEEAAPNLEVRYISREQWPQVFLRFLTNGGEAIPKFIFLSEAWVECGNWGPMPGPCRELIARGKACGDAAGARRRVTALYEADPGKRMVLVELLHLVDITVSQGV